MWCKFFIQFSILTSLLTSLSIYANDYVLEDTGIGMTRQELEFVVKHWTPQMQQAAADDAGDRIELLNRALASKKIAAEADKITLESDSERYWRLQLMLRKALRTYVVSDYMDNLQIPDMSALAEESYKTDKDKYALVSESRYTSHILFQCQAGECSRDDKRALAQEVLDKLRAGADFAELAKTYSEDPGSKDKGGVYDHWMVKGDTGTEPYYLQGTFKIAEVGDLAMVDTRFGIHIIRLDDIKPAHYLPYDQVKAKVISALENEYKKLSAKEFDAKFRISNDAFIDGAAMDEIFEPFKTVK